MTGALNRWATIWAEMALMNIDRPYPHAELVVWQGPHQALASPQIQHPAFYGSYDWHSAVEMHWLLVRLHALAPAALPWARIQSALDRHLAPAALKAELAFFQEPGHQGFERPYGWAWYLALFGALKRASTPAADRWRMAAEPLAIHLRTALTAWLGTASMPIRYGLHANTAWSLHHLWDWLDPIEDAALLTLIQTKARTWYGRDEAFSYARIPSGSDFLSPPLAEAALMAKVLDQKEFVEWLDRFLPEAAFGPVTDAIPLPDPSDGQASHLYGLNLSRSVHLAHLAKALPPSDARRPRFLTRAQDLAGESLPASLGRHYMLDHWLPAFALLALCALEE